MKDILISLFQARERVRHTREAFQNALDDCGLHAASWAGRVDGGENVSTVERIASRKEEAAERYAEAVRRMLAIETEAAPILDHVDAFTAALFEGRYFLNLKWTELEARHGITRCYLMRIQRKAFQAAEA